MQLGMKIPHDYSTLYVMTSNLNVECKLQWDFFNTIGESGLAALEHPDEVPCRSFN